MPRQSRKITKHSDTLAHSILTLFEQCQLMLEPNRRIDYDHRVPYPVVDAKFKPSKG